MPRVRGRYWAMTSQTARPYSKGTATPNFLLAILVMYFIYVKTGTMYLGLFSTEMLQNGMRRIQRSSRSRPW